MSSPNKEDQLLSEIAQFLADEQDMFAPFAFTAEEEKRMLNPHKAEVVAETVSDTKVETVKKPKLKVEPESKPEAMSDVISDVAEKPALKEDPKIQKPITLKERLEECQDLDQLRHLCEEADELHTDLEGTNLVFGVGNPNADLMLIGEAPGEQEDNEGEPFVGAAGQLLNKILAAIDFKREEVYIANILKHRPPGNRNPSPDERLRSLPYLLRQIDLIQPKLILCLGKVSGTTLLDREDTLKNLRGIFYPFRNTLLTVTYHPAALLRNPQWKRPVWEDVQKVKKKVSELTERA